MYLPQPEDTIISFLCEVIDCHCSQIYFKLDQWHFLNYKTNHHTSLLLHCYILLVTKRQMEIYNCVFNCLFISVLAEFEYFGYNCN